MTHAAPAAPHTSRLTDLALAAALFGFTDIRREWVQGSEPQYDTEMFLGWHNGAVVPVSVGVSLALDARTERFGFAERGRRVRGYACPCAREGGAACGGGGRPEVTLDFDRHTTPFRATVAGEVVRVTPMRLRWDGAEWLMECWVEERRRMVIFAVVDLVVEGDGVEAGAP